MDRSEEKTQPGFLRQTEMNDLIASEEDPITQHLMEMAAHVVISRVLTRKDGPIADFDLNYFMEIVQEFAREHKTLKTILEGKGDELIWLAEDFS
jgi:hypothetical protein